jgi:hypothetical protein
MISVGIGEGRRSTRIVVGYDRLSVQETGFLALAPQSWAKADIGTVRAAAHSDASDSPTIELQIVPHIGRPIGMLSERQRDELEWLADRIRRAMGLPKPVEASHLILDDMERQPLDSRVRCESRDATATLSVPRAGFRGAASMWQVAVIVNVVVGIMMAVFGLLGAFHDSWIPFVFFALFFCVGAWLVILAAQMTVERTDFAAGHGRLSAVRTGLLGVKRYAWAREEIAAIRAGPSSTIVQNERLMQLQIVPRTGKPVGLLTGRAANELAWIATLLRRALDVPAEADDSAGDEPIALPAASATSPDQPA